MFWAIYFSGASTNHEATISYVYFADITLLYTVVVYVLAQSFFWSY